ncbi:MAG: 50S ribosomal protein L23 [Thermodesulfovibrionia bacterium]|nr:50S ribosomal protein L23 [Thermodesulfovibrionia bacterium]
MSKEYNVLHGPLLTEKGSLLKETNNVILFKVSKTANKIEIKKAVEGILKVKVDSVRTVNCKGKKKRLGKYAGKRSDWKKAMVTLKEGEKFDFVEGA